MRVKITHPVRTAEGVIFPGRIVNLPDKEARVYIEQHKAIEVESEPKERKHGKRKNSQ